MMCDNREGVGVHYNPRIRGVGAAFIRETCNWSPQWILFIICTRTKRIVKPGLQANMHTLLDYLPIPRVRSFGNNCKLKFILRRGESYTNAYERTEFYIQLSTRILKFCNNIICYPDFACVQCVLWIIQSKFYRWSNFNMLRQWKYGWSCHYSSFHTSTLWRSIKNCIAANFSCINFF